MAHVGPQSDGSPPPEWEQTPPPATPLTVTWLGANPKTGDDAERLQRIIAKWAEAVGGSECAYLTLRCWSGDPDPLLRSRAADCGLNDLRNDPRAVCGMATSYAKKEAGAAYKDVLVRRQGLPWGMAIPGASNPGSAGHVPYVPTPTVAPGTESSGGQYNPGYESGGAGGNTPQQNTGAPGTSGIPATDTGGGKPTGGAADPAPPVPASEWERYVPYAVGVVVLVLLMRGR